MSSYAIHYVAWFRRMFRAPSVKDTWLSLRRVVFETVVRAFTVCLDFQEHERGWKLSTNCLRRSHSIGPHAAKRLTTMSLNGFLEEIALSGTLFQYSYRTVLVNFVNVSHNEGIAPIFTGLNPRCTARGSSQTRRELSQKIVHVRFNVQN